MDEAKLQSLGEMLWFADQAYEGESERTLHARLMKKGLPNLQDLIISNSCQWLQYSKTLTFNSARNRPWNMMMMTIQLYGLQVSSNNCVHCACSWIPFLQYFLGMHWRIECTQDINSFGPYVQVLALHMSS